MIKRIELKNFMSHEHTVIEPAAGLTVLIGPNNVGKSAIIAALQILCYNENSTYVMRHGTKQCSVTVETDDGHIIKWQRKTSPSYVIDGQKFDRLGRNAVPDELHQVLKLPKVDGSGQEQFDVHFGSQKTPIFLLDSSGSAAARFFASSSDAIRLVRMQQLHKDKIRDTKKERARLEAESQQLNTELAALEPVVQIEGHVAKLERQYQSLAEVGKQLTELELAEAALSAQQLEMQALKAETQALQPLTVPPVLADLESLDQTVSELERLACALASAQARCTALIDLTAPPKLADTDSLDQQIHQLQLVTLEQATAAQEYALLSQLVAPPALQDTEPLAQIVSLLQTVSAETRWESTRHQLLVPLTHPPVLRDVDSLTRTVRELESLHREVQRLLQERRFLQSIQQLDLQDEDSLSAVVSALDTAMQEVNQHHRLLNVANSLDTFPQPLPTEELKLLIDQFQQAEAVVDGERKNVDKIETELKQATEQLRTAAENQSCPVCGGPLEVDRLLQQATAREGQP